MEERIRATRSAERAVLVVGAIVLAWAATAACGYRFGAGDQAQYLARYVAVADPGTLAGDPYLVAFRAIGSFAWDPIAWVVPEGALAWVTLGLTLAAAAGSALALASVARAVLPGGLTRGARGALVCLTPAAALVVPKELNWFGLVSLSDMEMTATLLVMPIVLWGVALFVRGRAWWSFVMFAAAVPVQGQTAAWALAGWTLAMAWERRRGGVRLVPIGLVALGGVVGYAYARAHSGVLAGSMGEYREVGVRLYPQLIDPTRAPIAAWGGVAVLLAIGAFGFVGVRWFVPRGAGERAACDRLGVLAVASCLTPIACVAAVGAGVDEPMLWRLMPGRGLMVAQIAGVTFAAVWAGAMCAAERPRAAWIGVAVLVALVVWPFGAMGAIVDGAGVAALLAMVAVGVHTRTGELGRPRVARLAVPMVAAIAVGVVAFVGRAYPWVSPAGDRAWIEAQRWARAHTGAGAVFVTPPYRAGWRVGSHRATFGELRDGGLLFYAGDPVLAWADRMALLGMDTYQAAWFDGGPTGAVERERRAYAGALREHAGGLARAGVAYAVCEIGAGDDAEDGAGVGRVVWTNGVFEIRALGGAAAGGADNARP